MHAARRGKQPDRRLRIDLRGPRPQRSHRDQVRGDLNLYLGDHEIKAGGDYLNSLTVSTDSDSGGQLVRIFNDQGTRYYRHAYYAVSVQDLTPVPSGAEVRPRILDYGAYAQDSWRPTAGLTST